MLTRRGASAVELLVALVLAAIVMGAATLSLLRQQRTERTVTAEARDDRQLRAVSTLLAGTLGNLSAAAGDLAEATDTSIQLRDPVGGGLACDSAVGRAALALAPAGRLPLSSFASAPRASDSLWWYRDADSIWVGRRITSVGAGGGCRAPLQGLTSQVGVELDAADSIPAGTPLRVTRWERWSLYRSGDGSWQLGMREWSDPANRFAAPQPLAGPFLRGPVDGLRTGLRYFDASGTELAGPVHPADLPRVALVRLTALVAASAGSGRDTVRRDSADATLALAP